MPVCDTCGITSKCKVGKTCDCGGEFQSVRKFEAAKGEVFLQDNILLGLNPCGGYVVRVKGRPTAYPTTITGILKHIHDTNIRLSCLDMIEDLQRAEWNSAETIRHCAEQIIRQCPELKR